ncbi:MAG: tRNA (guanosine(46)-N7)-methyltransferase TrmB [Neisseriaceae bacterium]|nr:MAG: tRNA (guanosine(46)-N7)-methyltransferase TrmB [Neisseriaceae bacterium]
MDDKSNQKLSQIRGIRSYVVRQGHITCLQESALECLMPIWGIAYQNKKIDLDSIFSRHQPKILEIGFGMGQTTFEMAKNTPDIDYLCVEIYSPGVGNLLHLIEKEKLTNIRIIRHDVVEVVELMLEDEVFSGIHIYFPDPWHKKRHHKRRLIQSPFIQKLLPKLKSGGYIHLATDWEDYAYQILDVLSREKSLINKFETFAPRPNYRPVTKFELRGLRLGHGIWDIIFIKK